MGIQSSLPLRASIGCRTHPFSILQPHFHQGQSLGGGSSVSCREGSSRACSFTFSGVLQSDFCSNEGLRVVETSNRLIYAQSESPQDSLQDGDSPVCASVCAERRLDGVHRLEGCLLANPYTSGQLQVSQIRSFESSISVQRSVLRSLYGSAGFYPGHGSGVSPSTSSGHPHVSLPGRLASPSLLSSSSSPGIGDCNPSMSGPWNYNQLGEVQSTPITESGIPLCDSRLHSFQGFFLPAESREAMLNRRRILVLQHTARLFVEKAVRNSVISDGNNFRRKVTDAIPSTSPSPSMGSEGRLHSNSLGSGVLPGLGMVDGSRSSSIGHLPVSGQPSPRLLVQHLRLGLGRSSTRCNHFRPLVSGGSSSIDQCEGAPCGGVRLPSIPTPSVQFHSGSLCKQFYSSGLRPQTRGHSISSPQLYCSEDSPLG